jgi:hypothetical protein
MAHILKPTVGKTGVEPAISAIRKQRPLHLAHFPILPARATKAACGRNRTGIFPPKGQVPYHLDDARAYARCRARAERSAGFEPARPGWEPDRLPLTSRTLLFRVPAAGVEPAPPRFQHGASTVLASPGLPTALDRPCRNVPFRCAGRSVPRQGIEPCVCRLKAGGFAIEACEAFQCGTRSAEWGTKTSTCFRSSTPRSAFRASQGSGGWNRTSGLHLQRVASVPTRNPPERTSQVAEAGIEPAPSTFRGWHQYQH